MTHYCAIDLHSNNHVLVVIDDQDKRVYEKRLNNELPFTLQALSPFQDSLAGIAVGSKGSDSFDKRFQSSLTLLVPAVETGSSQGF